MGEFIIVCWRDIPAQLIAGKGRQAEKIKLSEKFEKAIDRCAMKVGAKESDDYLADWRKIRMTFSDDHLGGLISEAKKLEKLYDNKKLNILINNSGWNKK